ncbi:DUF1249 domain-containing protein [Candidatus Thioglobus autotrophicus]|uniref:DUF1249 domain-containing protein n=1 Tax=Candidatus Thioglobus autotrophicus TaxID=1705394 RepID=UPI0006B4EA98|nr:DUF1249 domain-containing protein [Candidatus Thioglobus autotrophicus]WPE17036.1 DUF1249 domain-containing protein [Candidatus Thioglobus autotrophicus]
MDLDAQYLHHLYNSRQAKTYSDVSKLFESNYQKILKIIPLIEQTAHTSIIRHSNCPDLHLIVEQRFTHTGIFTLTHVLKDTTHKPDIKFKVYFDAKLVEVLSVCNETMLNSKHPYLTQCSDLNIQWELNLFIERWLDYCLNQYQGKSWQML